MTPLDAQSTIFVGPSVAELSLDINEATPTTTIVAVPVQVPQMALIVAVPVKLAAGVNVALVPSLEKLHPLLHAGEIPHVGVPQAVALSVIAACPMQ